MVRVFDPLTPAQQTLTSTIMGGYAWTSNTWPVWQYVTHTMAGAGLDAAEVLTSMPSWQHSYGPVRVTSGHQLPQPEDRVALTAAGLYSTTNFRGLQMLSAIVAAIQQAHECLAGIEPMPTRVVPAYIDGSSLTAAVVRRSGVNLSSGQLLDLLGHEPPLWSGLKVAGDAWTWDLTTFPAARIPAVTSADALMLVLETHLGYAPRKPLRATPLPPEALPEALDHLNLAWIVTEGGKPLLSFQSAGIVASLALGANSADEFGSRCTALGDVLNRLNVPPSAQNPDAGPLVRLKDYLSTRVDAYDPAIGAIAKLRHVVDVRNSVSHPSGAGRLEKAYVALDLHHLRGDWDASWDVVRAHTVEALRSIRHALISTSERI